MIWTDNSSKEQQFTIQRATDSNFTAGLTTFTYVNPVTTVPNNVAFQDTTVARNTKYWYRVFANGYPVGDIQAYPAPSTGFPTMTADSVSNVFAIQVGTAPGLPASPTNLTRTVQAGPQVSLTWRDNSSTETGFGIERCTAVPPATSCSNFARIAVAGPRNNTGNVTYLDTTVTFGNSYSYRVNAFNGTGSSVAYTNTVSATLPAIPPAPTSFTVAAVKANGNNYTATLKWAYNTEPPVPAPSSFTIERANNATFTTGLSTFTAAGTARTLTQTVSRNTVYYYRIRANNNVGGSSAPLNALPFPIRTGP